MDKISRRQRYYFWQAGWWKQDMERIRWAATLGVIALLVAGGMIVDGQRHQGENVAPLETATAETAPAKTGTAQQPLAIAEAEAGSSQSSSMSQQGGTAGIDGPEESPALQAPPQSEGAAIEEPEDSVPVLANASGSLSLSLPVAALDGGELLRGYGYSWDKTTEDYRFHTGLDLAINPGSPVYAAAAGTVIQAEEDAYWGGVVVVEHFDGCTSTYKGVEPSVAKGDSVAAGSRLGRHIACPAELAEAPHIHVEATFNNERVDPAQYL